MLKPLRVLSALGLVGLAVVALAACGSSSSTDRARAVADSTRGSENAREVVAEVGATPITKAQVSHWMVTLAGRGYFNLSRKHTSVHGVELARPIPEGLVSDPPNYGRCVERLEAAAAGSSAGGARESGPQLLTKCRQLYEALKIQATSFLVNVQKTVGLARDEGVTVTDGEVERLFKQIKAAEYPTEADLQRYLASTHASVSDLLVDAKLDLLGNRLLPELRKRPVSFNEAEQRWTAKTNCQPGYVVEYCKQYKGGPTYPNTPPASVLVEQVAALATGQCVNPAACGKQVGK